MLCQFEKLLYPKDAHAASAGSYMVAVYRPCEIVRDSSGSILPQFKAVGYFLPVSNHLRYNMKGHWSRNTKHGTQFEVDSYDEVIIPSREGIIGYLRRSTMPTGIWRWRFWTRSRTSSSGSPASARPGSRRFVTRISPTGRHAMLSPFSRPMGSRQTAL